MPLSNRMKPSRGSFIRALLMITTAIALALPARAQTPVEIETVTLATGGLASVEGRMSGAGSAMSLPIEREHVADVLRTLVVTGDVPVRSVDLEAAEALGARTPEGRLLAGGLSDPAAILDVLIGEEVEIAAGTVRLSGRLLAYESIELPAEGEGDPRPALRVSVATPENRVAFASVPLGDPIAIEGEAVEWRLAALLPGLASATNDARRTLRVELDGEGRAGFRFVIPTTVWRPSYRATISDDGVALQGWATLENTTGIDWEGIDLRLAVGTPVAYAQDVYAPLRSVRPNAPFEVGETAEVPIVAPDLARRESASTMAADAMESRVFAGPSGEAVSIANFSGSEAPLAVGDVATDRALSVFDVPTPVTLGSARAMSVPFLTDAGAAERVVYGRIAEATPNGPFIEPLEALELVFSTEATVPGGLIAVYGPEGFIGDARFEGADAGEARIVPFAVSSDLDATIRDDDARRLVNVSVADGTVRIRRENRRVRRITLDAAEPATVVLDGERPASNGTVEATLVGTEAAVTMLDPRSYRIRASVPEGSSVLEIELTRPIVETFAVSDIPTSVIREALVEGGEIDVETRATLERLAASAERLAAIRRREGAANEEVANLRDALESDRDNLRALGPNTPEGGLIRQRIVERANALDALLAELRELRRQRLLAEQALRAG